jgi:membrane associated rhomboid family serine protease
LKKLTSMVSRFCYDHPNFGIPNLMLFIVAGNAIVFVLDLLSSGTFSPMLEFIPAYLFQGQIWRLITFIFVPDNTNVLFLAISLWFYYWIGSNLERVWGTTRFSLFYLVGVLASVVVGLLSCLVYGFDCTYAVTTTSYLNLSLFLSFATLFPDMEVLLMFIIPVKVKWLAYVDVFFLGLSILLNLAQGQFLLALLPLLALGNYLLFFGDALFEALRSNTRNIRHQTSKQTINFKKAVKQAKDVKGYIHKCCVCGITDTDAPDMEFRYCSKCAGYRCYCANHINNHVHISEE